MIHVFYTEERKKYNKMHSEQISQQENRLEKVIAATQASRLRLYEAMLKSELEETRLVGVRGLLEISNGGLNCSDSYCATEDLGLEEKAG